MGGLGGTRGRDVIAHGSGTGKGKRGEEFMWGRIEGHGIGGTWTRRGTRVVSLSYRFLSETCVPDSKISIYNDFASSAHCLNAKRTEYAIIVAARVTILKL